MQLSSVMQSEKLNQLRPRHQRPSQSQHVRNVPTNLPSTSFLALNEQLLHQQHPFLPPTLDSVGIRLKCCPPSQQTSHKLQIHHLQQSQRTILIALQLPQMCSGKIHAPNPHSNTREAGKVHHQWIQTNNSPEQTNETPTAQTDEDGGNNSAPDADAAAP